MSYQSPNHKENRKRYLEKHKDRLSNEGKERYRCDTKHYIKYMISRAKARAKSKNIPFDLCFDDIVIPEQCPILGIPFEVSNGKGPSPSSPSLDRIVPELGYVKDNIMVISMRANQIKTNATADEIEKVLIFLKESK
jgi:hypothetical protein